MNPQEYLAEFHKPQVVDQSNPRQTSALFLDGMLRRLGLDNPKSGLDSELGQIADSIIDLDQICMDVVPASRTPARNRRGIAKQDLPKEETPEELYTRIDREAEYSRERASYLSSIMLANAVKLCVSNRPDDAVNNAMGGMMTRVAKSLRPHGYIIDVERDIIDHEQIGPTRVTAVNNPNTGRLESWLRNVKEWGDGPLDLITGFHVETDGFVALLEWCRYMHNGYIPVFAPRNIDCQQYFESRRNSNLQSDILLCRINQDFADIIPVQIKTTIGSKNRDKYDENVILIGAQDLDLVSQQPASISHNGRVHTGVTTNLQAGRHTKGWTKAVGSKTNRKQMHKQFIRTLGGAFKQIDQLLQHTRAA